MMRSRDRIIASSMVWFCLLYLFKFLLQLSLRNYLVPGTSDSPSCETILSKMMKSCKLYNAIITIESVEFERSFEACSWVVDDTELSQSVIGSRMRHQWVYRVHISSTAGGSD